MSDHLSQEFLCALADGELSTNQLAGANEHLAGCPSCTSNALYQSLLKSATARAGQRYALPSQLQTRLAHLSRQVEASPALSPSRGTHRPLLGFGVAGWATAFAMLLILGSVVVLQRSAQQQAITSSEFAGIVTEACDQHVATLAANLPPQVLSSDRHTVKPWFQGKIPFSFNLPETLPGDTKLEGANLTYLRGQPTALLLYSIGKHRVSVFVQARTNTKTSDRQSADRAGFHVDGFSTSDLQVVAVSDVDPVRLANLVGILEQSQAGVPASQSN
jgi:anti-sigma factor RsiW